MPTASAVSICSNALQRLGADPISSFEDGTKFAGLCGNVWPTVRDELLGAHNWNCCIKRTQLAPLAQPPEFDYPYQFQLPGDWMKTLQVGKRGHMMDYTMEGRRILAHASLLPLKYVWRNDVPASWDDAMVLAAELKMAAAIAYAVTKSTTLRDSYAGEADMALKRAKTKDGQDVPADELAGYPLYEARFSGGL